jgi:hypothetical protein
MKAAHTIMWFLVVAGLCLCTATTTWAQTGDTTDAYVNPGYHAQADTSGHYIITLIDGTVLKGVIMARTSNEVTLKTENLGTVTLQLSNIREIKKLESSQVKNGVYWFPNPHPTRYFFAPSAINLKKGEGYYQNAYIIFNSFNYGVSDNFSIGGGIEFISLFASLAMGNFQPIVFVTPKVGFKVADRVHAGGGLLYVRVPNFDSNESGNHALLAYGVGTYGTTDHNATLGAGWGYFEGETTSRPILTINGMTRVGRNVSLVTENWFAPFQRHTNTRPGVTETRYVYQGLASYGIRFFGEKLSVDLGFINNPDIFEVLVIGIPYVDFVVKF